MPPDAPETAVAPSAGIWRVGRGDNPLAVRLPDSGTLNSSTSGTRFDDAGAGYGVLYFGSSLTVCFGETLSRFRPSLKLLSEVDFSDEWRNRHFMEVGAIPAEWRLRRTAVRVRLPRGAVFLDVESPVTHDFLRPVLALGLSQLGYDDLNVATVRGPDRRITRLISGWAFRATREGEPLYAGIRYLSKLNTDWECWAVFEGVPLQVLEFKSIEKHTPELQEVAHRWDLTIH